MRGQCPICGNDSERATDHDTDTVTVVCPRCGRFTVAGRLVASVKEESMSADWRWRLSCAIRSAVDEAGALRERITNENYKEIIDRARWPIDALDQADRLLLEIARR